jgi:hypothetical protein
LITFDNNHSGDLEQTVFIIAEMKGAGEETLCGKKKCQDVTRINLIHTQTCINIWGQPRLDLWNAFNEKTVRNEPSTTSSGFKQKNTPTIVVSLQLDKDYNNDQEGNELTKTDTLNDE